jgi:hypothetical protein
MTTVDDPAAGIALLFVSAVAVVATAWVLRRRGPSRLVDVALALEGAGLALGGLLLLEDVGTGSWIVGPVALAILTPLHVRALFAGEGPFRT